MTAQKIRLIMILSLLSLVAGSSAQQDSSPPTPPSGVKVRIGDILEPKSQTSGPIAGTSGATRVRISLASNGDYHMAFLLPTSELQGEVTEGKIYYARYRNGIWSETLLCADLGARSVPIHFADVAGDKNGDAYIVWVSRDRNRFYFVTIRDASEVNIESREAQNALRADVVVDGLDFVRAMYRNKLPSERNFFLSRPIEA